jgi:hypothetical protein
LKRNYQIQGNPGHDNTFVEVPNGSYNPNASVVNNNYYCKGTRMGSRFQHLSKEIADNTTGEIKGDLLIYNTKLEGTLDMEVLLQKFGFCKRNRGLIMGFMQQYAMKVKQFGCYPAAQKIILFIFAEIKSAFVANIEPMVRRRAHEDDVMKKIHEDVVTPVMFFINANGAEDRDLQFNADHIIGMIFFLVSNGHLCIYDQDDI